MHSSSLLFASEFQAFQLGITGTIALADAFSGYHPQDRTVIVSLVWEDAFLQNAVAVTALTALFYDAQRALGPPFYTYPSHYLLACKGADGIRTRGGAIPLSVQEAGRPWGHLDLWPDTQWIEASSDAISLLQTIFALHAHRVFWPEDMAVGFVGKRLPGYVRRILASRLKAVYFYNPAAPNLEIAASAGARKLLERTPQLFPGGFPPPDRGRYRVVEGEAFLSRFDDCFEAFESA